MSKPVGRPPKPVEQKRRAGNPGHRPLPDVVIPIPTSATAPEPHRPLGTAGRQFWERVWNVGFTWISPQMDVELLQIVSEQYLSQLRSKCQNPSRHLQHHQHPKYLHQL